MYAYLCCIETGNSLTLTRLNKYTLLYSSRQCTQRIGVDIVLTGEWGYSIKLAIPAYELIPLADIYLIYSGDHELVEQSE